MQLKYLLNQLDEHGNVEKSKPMKTLREISKLLNIEYHQARLLYLKSKQAPKGSLHPLLKELSKRYSIVDNGTTKFNDNINFD
jgi:hypothetical protein